MLSFFVGMRQHLHIPQQLDGNVWRYLNAGPANKRHHHAELELNLVTRGTGTYLLANRNYRIRRGDMLWLYPAQEHVLIDQSSDFEMWIAVFRRRAIKRSLPGRSNSPLLRKEPSGDCCRRLAQRDLARSASLLAELASARGEPDLLNAGLGYVLLHSWSYFERAADVPVLDVHPAVERAAHLIRGSRASLSGSELARRAGLSPARLSRLFKQQTGFALVDFRNRQRLENFMEIYGTGQRQTMLNAALEAGFGSYPQFHRVFKRVVGCSPREYTKPEET